MVDNCEELGKAEALVSHCCQLTPCSERKLETTIDLVNLGDWFLEGRVRNRDWGVGR